MEKTYAKESPTTRPDAQPHDAVVSMWDLAGYIWSRKRFLIGSILAVALLSVVISYLLPIRYQAEARMVLPSGGAGIGGLLETIAPGASALLGKGTGGDYTRLMTLLQSRTMMERVVKEFNLQQVYNLPNTPQGHAKAIDALRKNVILEVNIEYDFLAIRTLDTSPERAAAITNYLVDQLSLMNNALSTSNARQNREFIEERLKQAETDLDSAQAALQAFQETYGVFELESQAEAFISSMAEVQARLTEAEIRYNALSRQFGADNPQVEAARVALEASRFQVRRLTSGEQELMPMNLRELPARGREYARLQQDLLIDIEILKLVRPLYEQYLMEEKRNTDAVQVIDAAIPPLKKAEPRRALICVSLTLSYALLALALIIAQAWLHSNRPRWQQALRRLASKPSTPEVP